MNKQEFLQSIKNFFEDAYSTIEKKNHDYGGDEDLYKNFNASSFVGVSPEKAIMVRMLDKISRVSTLLDKEAKVKEESMDDTLMDLANYASILNTRTKNREARKELMNLVIDVFDLKTYLKTTTVKGEGDDSIL